MPVAMNSSVTHDFKFHNK